MASKITDLTALTGANAATTDLIPIVDVSDTTMAASGTNKSITRAESFKNLPPLSFSTDAYITRYAAKQLMISGDGVGATTNAGIIAGTLASNAGAIWPTNVVPGITNYTLYVNSGTAGINASTNVGLYINDSYKFLSQATLNTSVNPLSITDTTDSSSTTTGSLKAAGGLGVAKTLSIGGNTHSYGVYTSATSYSRLAIKHATTTLTNVTGATVTATGLIPAKAKMLGGVNTKVVANLGPTGGTTGYAVGTAGDPNLWGDVVGLASTVASGQADATADPVLPWSASAQDVVITAAGGPFDGDGDIFIDVAYIMTEAD